jgi:hypothetical protein
MSGVDLDFLNILDDLLPGEITGALGSVRYSKHDQFESFG